MEELSHRVSVFAYLFNLILEHLCHLLDLKYTDAYTLNLEAVCFYNLYPHLRLLLLCGFKQFWQFSLGIYYYSSLIDNLYSIGKDIKHS